MAERVYWHVGLPKTGTTYLQDILWSNRDALAAEGIALPGRGHRDHLWAALDMQDDPSLKGRDPRARGAWDRLVDEVDRTAGTALLTHEFFCAASAEQAQAAVARLAPAEVHVVITARDAAGMLSAGWQERVKNGVAADLRRTARRTQRSQFGWWTWDLEGVLRRWLSAVPAGRIHVLPVPSRSESPDQHWLNLAATIGFEGDAVMPGRALNQSLGVVQVEALRAVNTRRDGSLKPYERGRWIRSYLGENHLARQGGERLRLDDDLFEECRVRSARAHDLVLESGVDVVGDPRRLLAPTSPPGDRTVSSVSTQEVNDALADLVGSMLQDVRDLQADSAPSAEGGPATLVGRVRRRIERLQNR